MSICPANEFLDSQTSSLCSLGWDSCWEGQRKARESDPSLQTQKLGHPRGTKYSKQVIFLFKAKNGVRRSVHLSLTSWSAQYSF